MNICFVIKIKEIIMFEACALFVWCLKAHFYAIYWRFGKERKKVKKFQSVIFGHFLTAMAYKH